MAHEMRVLSNRFERVHRWLTRPIRYICPGARTYTIPGCRPRCCTAVAESCPGRRVIALCPPFWGSSFSDDGRASVIIPEAMHALFRYRRHPTASARGRARRLTETHTRALLDGGTAARAP